MGVEIKPPAPAPEQAAIPRYSPIKLRGGEPISITIMRGRGHGSEHPQIAAWEASQKLSQVADESADKPAPPSA
jgi:hypothetical protein